MASVRLVLVVAGSTLPVRPAGPALAQPGRGRMSVDAFNVEPMQLIGSAWATIAAWPGSLVSAAIRLTVLAHRRAGSAIGTEHPVGITMPQLSTGLGAGAVRRGWLARSLPSLVELLLVLAAIVALLPAFARVAEIGAGRDRRFAELGFRVTGLPEAVLPATCAAYAALAEAPLRERLCEAVDVVSTAPPLSRLPALLTQAASRSARAFLAPVREAEASLKGLQLQQREGTGELRDMAAAIAAIEAEIQPFVERFQLANADAAGPLPLWCAVRWVEAALAEPAAAAPGGAAMHDMARANAVLLLAAALDGRVATESLAATAVLPASGESPSPPCEVGGIAALSRTAALMGDARQALSNSRKNEAMRALMQSAGWQWAGAMLLGFALLLWSRRRWPPALGVAGALALWAFAAWLARVPWPLAGNRGFQPARLEQALGSPPAGFVLWLGAAGVLVLFWALVRGSRCRLDGRRDVCPGDEFAHRLRGTRACHRPRLAVAARPVGQQPLRQPLPGALPPGSLVAGHAASFRCCCSCASRCRAGSAGCSRSAAKRRGVRHGGSVRGRGRRRCCCRPWLRSWCSGCRCPTCASSPRSSDGCG